MADASVNVPKFSEGVQIDNTSFTRNGKTVHRQRVETYNGSAQTENSTNTPLAAGATWTGTAVDVSSRGSVTCSCKTDQNGTLYMEFSVDGVNWDSSLPFTVVAGVNEFHRLSVTRQYYRARFTNTSGSDQTYLRLQSLSGEQAPLTSPLNGSVASDADSLVTRSVLMGQDDGGNFNFVPVSPEGHLEVAVHGPILPFRSLHVEKMTPIFQIDAVYGISDELAITTSVLSGSVTHADNMFKCATGTTQFGIASFQSKERLRYRPGQGAITRFTALFSAPAADSILVAGTGTAETGFYIGYNGTQFGILYSTDGKREVRTLTVTTASTSTNNVQVTLNGVAYTVTGMTNSGSTLRTAYEISKGTFAGWQAEAIGSTVVFVSGSAGAKSGTYSVAQSGAATPVAGTFAQTLAGVAATDTWYPQSAWDDPMDGTGSSGFTADWTKGNVFQIGMQYLGFGVVTFEMETYGTGGRDATFSNMLTLRFPNTLTKPHMSQPSMPFTMAAYSAGSTTDVWVKTGSVAGFVEGDKTLTGPRLTYGDTSTTVSTGAYYALMTIRNDLMYKGRVNQSVVNLISFGGAHDDATPVTLYLLKNATLVGNPNFSQWSPSSTTYVDTDATTATISDNNQVVVSIPIGQGGQALLQFTDSILLDPGETVTVAATAVTGTSTFTIFTLNTREDQ